jgi:hypothetical protein
MPLKTLGPIGPRAVGERVKGAVTSDVFENFVFARMTN